jgi:hypothetical protein
MNMNRYFRVTAKCGHVTKGHYIDKDFPVISESASMAAQTVKQYPRVKKHLKHAITSCIEISFDEYKELKTTMKADGYFRSKCKKDQMVLCPNIQEEVQELDSIETHKKEPNHDFRTKKEYEAFRSLLLSDLFEYGIVPTIVKI